MLTGLWDLPCISALGAHPDPDATLGRRRSSRLTGGVKRNRARAQCRGSQSSCIQRPRPAPTEHAPLSSRARFVLGDVATVIAIPSPIKQAIRMSSSREIGGPGSGDFQKLAGVEGLEPPTPGFGDRCSTN